MVMAVSYFNINIQPVRSSLKHQSSRCKLVVGCYNTRTFHSYLIIMVFKKLYLLAGPESLYSIQICLD